MRKRFSALLLALFLACSLLVSPAFASTDETGVEQTIKALGIMVGDTSGNMNLGNNVTRAQFAKMLVMASSYKDSIGEGGSGYSLFKDVKSSYWASEYIKIAVDNSWIVGYTDGTFRPYQSITLEQACTMALRLLGYDSANLAGSYPAAQLNKAASLGLRDQITLSKGASMTRQDCMYLFYNLLTAQTNEGKAYATTIGYSVSNGQVDYAAIVENSLSGPFVCTGSAPTLSFTPTAVYRDGAVSALSAMSEYDVYYYSANLRTVWVYTDRVSGTVSAISPSVTAPTAVTVAGTEYQLGTAAAVYKISAMGGTAVGDTVMLLLGMGGSVVDVVTGSSIDTTYYGVVQSYANVSSTSGSATAQTKVSVACTDGTVHTFVVDKAVSYSTGALVCASVSGDGTTVSSLSTQTLEGSVNSAGTSLGSREFASGVQILDTNSDGGYVKIAASRLAGCSIGSSSVRYYVLNENGQISHLILNDATGDIWTYGYMISASNSSSGITTSGSYVYMLNGQQKTLSGNGVAYSVKEGGFAVRYNVDGSVKSMKNLSSVKLTALGSVTATGGTQQYRLASGVQVYLFSGGNYYASTLSAINPDDYTLTGWYDNFGCSVGGRIRVIVAASN